MVQRWHARRFERLTERVDRRRGRLTARWERLTRQRRREGLALRLRHRWYVLTERIEPWIELVQIRWYRFIYRLVSGRVLAALGLSLLLAVALIALLPLGVSAPRGSDPVDVDTPTISPSTIPTSEPQPSLAPDPSGLSTYTNELAGYRFSYPSDWDVSTFGTRTVLTDPNGQIEVSFEDASPGSLQQTSDGTLAEITSTYGAPETIATEVSRTSQGYRSIAVGGTASDATGAAIRFLAIAIEGPDHNQVLLVTFPADTDPLQFDELLEIVNSFRIDPAA